MPIYMDLHIVPGVNAKDVADAHSMDVLMEKEHSCRCLTYWIDELRGYVFCLIDAPSKETVVELHTRAHGLVPSKIIEVEPSMVQAFLGRITDPESATVTDKGLVIMDDTSFRIIMHLQLRDPVLLRQELGPEGASRLMEKFKKEVREGVIRNNGREVLQEAGRITASFVEGAKSFAAAQAILSSMQDEPGAEVRISLHAGEPVMHSDKLFGDTVQLLRRLNMFPRTRAIALTSGIRELLDDAELQKTEAGILLCSSKDEAFVSDLFDTLDARHSDERFDMDEYCRHMAMSQSGLYRKTTDIFQLSPNQLLRNYRLQRAAVQLRAGNGTVSQVSFDTGFASASYFTKCFKDHFGMLPMAYRETALSLAL